MQCANVVMRNCVTLEVPFERCELLEQSLMQPSNKLASGVAAPRRSHDHHPGATKYKPVSLTDATYC
jgi:hypothetical protein